MTLALFESNRLPLSAAERWSIKAGDCVESMRGIAAESIDLIVTDPAYSSLDKHRATGTTTRLAKAWFQTVPNEYFRDFFREAYRVLKPNSHCYVMCDAETMFEIKPMGQEAGFKFWKPIVWDKMKMGMGYHYRARCEFVLFFEKGKRRLNSLGIKDVLEIEEEADDILKIPRVAGGQFDDDWRKRREQSGEPYPTEKPVGLSQVLIQQSSELDEIVMDPFSGSASVGHAALSLARRFVGYDLSASAVELGRARLESVQ